MNKTIKREIDVIIHGQTIRFRVLKYIVLISLSFLMYNTFGRNALFIFLVSGAILGIVFHFFLRWKTKGWTKKWGRVPLPKNR